MTATLVGAPARASIRHATESELDHWDTTVRRFPTHRVVHTRAWIESLRASGLGKPLYLVLERDDDIVGCFPGLITTVGGVRLFGSPLPGWQSLSMGPVLDPARITTAECMEAALRHLETTHGVRHVEVLHPELDHGAMRACGFNEETVYTFRAPLFPGDEQRTFHSMRDSARRNVARARRLGLVVKREQGDNVDDFIDAHYAQLREVYVRGGNEITFSKRRLAEMVRHMHAAGNLYAVSVYLPGERVRIATGTFLVEGRELLLWMWAHRPHYRWYRATELMTWSAMQYAMTQGCESVDFNGRGDFKANFGAELNDTKRRWIRSRSPLLGLARRAAQTAHKYQQVARGQTARVARVATSAIRRDRAERGPSVACVLGDVDLVRALGLGGISSAVVAPPGSAVRYSRHTRDALPWFDAWKEPDRLVNALLEYSNKQPQPPVLFYQDDRSLLLVSRHRAHLQNAFRFVIPSEALVEQLVDKAQFQDLAATHSLPIPPARVLRPGDEPFPGDLDLGGPFIVKPLTRRADQWVPIAGNRKAIRCQGREALRALWPQLADSRMRFLAQALVPGDEAAIESYHLYVDARGIVADFTGRKLRTHPVEFGDSCAVMITDAPDVAALGRDICARLGLTGVAKLDFKRDPDGRLWLFEINPRFTLWHHPGAAAGVNIPALVYDDLTGKPRPVVPKARAGVRWSKPWADRVAARSAGMPMLQWLRWTVSCEAKRAVALSDPMPLLVAGAIQALSPAGSSNARNGGPHL